MSFSTISRRDSYSEFFGTLDSIGDLTHLNQDAANRWLLDEASKPYVDQQTPKYALSPSAFWSEDSSSSSSQSSPASDHGAGDTDTDSNSDAGEGRNTYGAQSVSSVEPHHDLGNCLRYDLDLSLNMITIPTYPFLQLYN
jgi:hypothetical protein